MSTRVAGEPTRLGASAIWREPYRLVLAGASGLVGQLAALGLLATSGWLITTASLRPPILTLSVAIGAVRLFALLRGAGRYTERLASHDLALRGLARLRIWAYRHLERLVPGGLASIGRGDVLARMVGDVDATQDLVTRTAIPSLTGAATAVAAVVLAGLILPPAAVILAAGLVLAGIAVPAGGYFAGRPAARELASERGDMSGHLVEMIEGVSDLLAFDASGIALDRLRAKESSLARRMGRLATISGLASAMSLLSAWIALAAVIALAAHAKSDGHIGGVDVAVLAFVSLAAFDALGNLPSAISRLDTSLGALQRISALGTMPAPVAEPANATMAMPSGEPPLRTTPMPAPPVYELSGVSARYSNDQPEAIEDIDLCLTPGTRVALVGPSGAGKSTLAFVLLRFIEITNGKAALGGMDVTTLPTAAVREFIAWAPQEPHIFAASVAANLRLARPDADDTELVDALDAVGLSSWLARLDDGIETVLGERGLTLSGGERQRVGVARALVAKRPILILDEPTAHLDPANEALVRKQVLAASRDASLLWITHSLAGLDDFDEVVVLGGGRVVQRVGAGEPSVLVDGLAQPIS